MNRFLVILIFLSLTNLYFSNAQDVRLVSVDRHPIEGAVVRYTSLSDPAKSVMVISNFKGEAWLLGFPYPMIRKVNKMGFLERVDTIYNAMGVSVIVMTSAPAQLGEVTVTGNHVPGYQKNAVVPVQVLKREDIEKRGAVTVQDLLTQELNMRVSFDPALGSSLTLQGTGGEHIKILVDGVPVIGRQNGNIDLAQLNLSNIERVEIVKGPMSVLYGTDALGGVINLITKTQTRDNWALSAGSYFESTGHYNVEANASLGLKSTAAAVNFGRNYFDGWDPVNKDGRDLLWNPREQYFGNLKLTRKVRNLDLTLQSSYFNEKVINKTEPVITPYMAYATDQYYHTVRWGQQVLGEVKLSPASMFNFTGAYSKYIYRKNTWRKDLVQLSEELTPDNLDDDTTVFDACFGRVNYVLGGKNARWSLLSGADMNYETGMGQKMDNKRHSIADVAVYASFDYRILNVLTLRPSFRMMYNSQFSTPLIPSFSAMLVAGKHITARASVSMGFRAPSLKEQYLFFVDNGIHNVRGNPDLKAETSRQVMASVEFRKAGAAYVFTAEPGVFYNRIVDKISLIQFDANSTLYTYVNLDEFSSRGIEFKSRLAKNRFTLQGGMAYTGTFGTIEGDMEQPEIAWYPEYNASADYKILKTGTVFSAFWKYFGDRPVFVMQEDGTVDRFSNESFSIMDASLQQRLMKEKVSLTAGIRNILNVTSVRSLGSGGAHGSSGDGQTPVGTGTSYFVKLTVSLK